jgi:hypothetical protein
VFYTNSVLLLSGSVPTAQTEVAEIDHFRECLALQHLIKTFKNLLHLSIRRYQHDNINKTTTKMQQKKTKKPTFLRAVWRRWIWV